MREDVRGAGIHIGGHDCGRDSQIFDLARLEPIAYKPADAVFFRSAI